MPSYLRKYPQYRISIKTNKQDKGLFSSIDENKKQVTNSTTLKMKKKISHSYKMFMLSVSIYDRKSIQMLAILINKQSFFHYLIIPFKFVTR